MTAVTLTEGEQARCRQWAEQRTDKQAADGRASPTDHGKTAYAMHLEGVLSEFAVAKHYGLTHEYVGYSDDHLLLKADVGDHLHVRSTNKRSGNLLAHGTDPPDGTVVLVRTHDAHAGILHLVGKCKFAAAQQDRYWRSDWPRPCYCYPAVNLEPP